MGKKPAKLCMFIEFTKLLYSKKYQNAIGFLKILQILEVFNEA